ncbi:hypothetical protein Lbir_1750 [Legionella birminghamensis]|uniref:Uncharacterized protein n=2 Tax=Legionella TaxID=445 RepID=A0A378JVE6_9GAMM|nr:MULTISPECIES: hypothetical protein [Legionella]KTC71412.1 hypothetical protein Lbir_1750 [Legionella birminghamensis]SEG47998.1 hypothetical protein SAMN02746093_03097 [Legionella quinlivanii DSM 21216]STX60979.1 Uncharacterised protein [Legionella birminghamensis]STY49765.1 Uncharacterised protein [Legionella quinlivanii]STY49860.1 Uncharacterised protein [Legionella quinlivanii]
MSLHFIEEYPYPAFLCDTEGTMILNNQAYRDFFHVEECLFSVSLSHYTELHALFEILKNSAPGLIKTYHNTIVLQWVATTCLFLLQHPVIACLSQPLEQEQ